ncbi:serine/threonine protein kinase [bacterium]|nr:serine/threonine protein kinase [bacterium]
MKQGSLEVGTIVQGRYRILSILGQGGMGTVYLGVTVNGGAKLALKELTATGQPEGAVRQFRREAALLSDLRHPVLVPVVEFFRENDRYYLAMEYVDGVTLAILLRRKPAISIPQALDWTRQLLSVLETLHGHHPPILFRDLKPSNIMIDAHERVRLIDFGIARLRVEGEETTTFLKGVGSTGYAPLEQYGEEGGTDERSDIYALGATLYSMLARRVPESPVNRVASGLPLVSIRLSNPDVCPHLEAVVLRMLSLKKDSRYRSCKEVRAALDAVASGCPAPQDAPEDSVAPHFQVTDTCYLGSAHPLPLETVERVEAQPDVSAGLRWITFCLLAFLAAPYLFKLDFMGVFEYLGLPFHGMGHLLGLPFGGVGATLLGLAMPLIVASIFGLYWSGKRAWFLGLTCALGFFGSLVGQGHLLRDARKMTLVLPGHEDHDWNFVLGRLRLLKDNEYYGDWAILLGRVGLAVTLALLVVYLLRSGRR